MQTSIFRQQMMIYKVPFTDSKLLSFSDNKDDIFEVLDVAEAGKNWLERALNGELSKKSVPVQVGIGGGTGL